MCIRDLVQGVILFLSSTYGLGTFLCKLLHMHTCYVLKAFRTQEGVSHVLAPAEPQTLGQTKNKCVSGNVSVNILGRVGTHFFFIFFFGK